MHIAAGLAPRILPEVWNVARQVAQMKYQRMRMLTNPNLQLFVDNRAINNYDTLGLAAGIIPPGWGIPIPPDFKVTPGFKHAVEHWIAVCCGDGPGGDDFLKDSCYTICEALSNKSLIIMAPCMVNCSNCEPPVPMKAGSSEYGLIVFYFMCLALFSIVCASQETLTWNRTLCIVAVIAIGALYISNDFNMLRCALAQLASTCLPESRVIGNVIHHLGRAFVVERQCTLFLLWAFICFTWVVSTGFVRGMLISAAGAPILFVINTLRIYLAIYFNSDGLSWLLSHDLPYCVIWALALAAGLHTLVFATRNKPYIICSSSNVLHNIHIKYNRHVKCSALVCFCIFVFTGCRETSRNGYRHKILSVDTNNDENIDYVLVSTFKGKHLLWLHSLDGQGRRAFVSYRGGNPVFGEGDYNGDGRPDEMVIWQGNDTSIYSIQYVDDYPQYTRVNEQTNENQRMFTGIP